MHGLRICFASPHSYPLFNTQSTASVGGSEKRAWLLGSKLSQKEDLDISFLVLDHGQPPIEDHGPVTLFSHPGYSIAPTSFSKPFFHRLKNRLSRSFLNPRPTEQWFSFYDSIPADIFCTFGVSDFSAEMIQYCKQANKKSILFLGSDYDLSSDYKKNSTKKNLYGNSCGLCHFCLANADYIIAQSKTQQNLLQQRFKRSSTIIRNPVDLSFTKKSSPTSKDVVLWVGKSSLAKRADRFIQLTRKLPNLSFVMVMNSSEPHLHEEVLRSCPQNVQIHEYVPHHKIEKLYQQAFAFVNTSDFEGFPNTFLEAGKFSVPIVSYHVNPDHFIDQFNCGTVGNEETMVAALNDLANLETSYHAASKNVYNYVQRFHCAETISKKLEELLITIKKPCIE